MKTLTQTAALLVIVATTGLMSTPAFPGSDYRLSIRIGGPYYGPAYQYGHRGYSDFSYRQRFIYHPQVQYRHHRHHQFKHYGKHYKPKHFHKHRGHGAYGPPYWNRHSHGHGSHRKPYWSQHRHGYWGGGRRH